MYLTLKEKLIGGTAVLLVSYVVAAFINAAPIVESDLGSAPRRGVVVVVAPFETQEPAAPETTRDSAPVIVSPTSLAL